MIRCTLYPFHCTHDICAGKKPYIALYTTIYLTVRVFYYDSHVRYHVVLRLLYRYHTYTYFTAKVCLKSFHLLRAVKSIRQSPSIILQSIRCKKYYIKLYTVFVLWQGSRSVDFCQARETKCTIYFSFVHNIFRRVRLKFSDLVSLQRYTILCKVRLGF